MKTVFITDAETGITTSREMTAEEIAANTPSPEETAASVRRMRDNMLSSSDWTQVLDAPVNQTAWATYRQALRDTPNQVSFPNEVTWPTKP